MGSLGKGSRVRRSQEPRFRSTPPFLSISYRAHSPCAGQGFFLKCAPPWDPTWQGPARRPWATGMMPFLNSWGWREWAHRAPAGREGLDLLRWWALLSLPRREGTPERELGLLRLLGVPGALYTLTSARPCGAPVRSGQRHLTECDTEAGRGMRGPLPKASVSLLTLPPAPTPCPDRRPPPQGVARCLGWVGGMDTRFLPISTPLPPPTGHCHLFLGLRGLGAAPSLGCPWVPKVPSCAPLSSPPCSAPRFPLFPQQPPRVFYDRSFLRGPCAPQR